MKPFPPSGVLKPMRTHRFVSPPFAFVSCLWLLLAGGCASDEHESPGSRSEQAHRPRQVPLDGSEKYFDGTVTAEITLGAMEGAGGLPQRDGEPGSGAERGGGGRHRGRRGGGYGGDNYGGRGSDGEGGGPPGGMRPRLHGAMGAAEMIHLKLTNNSPARVTVDIADFVSPLGNFAVQPETLTLEPGQTLETEPMSSRLAGPMSAVDATLTLRVSGHAEKKTLTLRAVTPAAATAPAPLPSQ